MYVTLVCRAALGWCWVVTTDSLTNDESRQQNDFEEDCWLLYSRWVGLWVWLHVKARGEYDRL